MPGNSVRNVVAALVVSIGAIGAIAPVSPVAAADTMAPTVGVSRPAEGVEVGSTVRLVGSARDDRGVTAVRLRLRRSDGRWFDGTSWRATAAWFRADLAERGATRTRWSRQVSLAAGRVYTLTAVAVDRAGHRSEPVVRRFRTVARPDLSVDVTAVGLGVNIGLFTADISNLGGPTTGPIEIRFSVDVPLAQEIVTNSADGWTCSASADEIVCTRSDPFDAGQRDLVDFLISPTVDGGVAVRGTARVSTSGDANASNDLDDEVVLVWS